MMKMLLLFAFLSSFLQFTQAQEEIVKWTFPTGLVDTLQNGTNTLNSTRTIRIEGAGPITVTNGVISGDFAATATNWNDGANVKNWNIKFKTTGYNYVQISSKQRAGGTNGGPKDFKLQFKIGSSGTWADVPGGTITLGNDWTTGVISNLDLPTECQNQSNSVYIRWIMASNADYNGGNVTAVGISKIDDIIVTGMLITGFADQKAVKELSTYPNPSSSAFSIVMAKAGSLIEIYNADGQLVYKTIPDNEILTPEKTFPAGLYFIKAISNGKVSCVKHIVR